jgi:hypothetical protein
MKRAMTQKAQKKPKAAAKTKAAKSNLRPLSLHGSASCSFLSVLGNPESKYAKNRHNVGFMAIDSLAAAYGFGDFREKYHGLLAEGQIGHEKVLLLKAADLYE